MKYVAPWWLPGGNLQTIWPALYARRVSGAAPAYRRERWDTPDGDFIDVDFLVASAEPAAQGKPLLVLFHGLEGSSRSHYAEAFADWCARQGIAFAVPHFRGCSGELNLGPRAYHSGDFEEIDWMLRRLRARHTAQGGGPLLAVGVSLGGNALLRWAGEMGAGRTGDGGRGGRGVVADRPGRRRPRDRPRLQPAGLYPHVPQHHEAQGAEEAGAAPRAVRPRRAAGRARSVRVRQHLHRPIARLQDTEDYWARASAKPHLASIRIPALVVNALNDPFVPASSLPKRHEVGPHVTLWQPAHGGHVGFTHGRLPGHVQALPEAVGRWLLGTLAPTRQ